MERFKNVYQSHLLSIRIDYFINIGRVVNTGPIRSRCILLDKCEKAFATVKLWSWILLLKRTEDCTKKSLFKPESGTRSLKVKLQLST